MGSQKVALDLPDEIVALLGSRKAAADKAREALVIELLREARISRGLAARLLGLTPWQILDLIAERRILSGPEAAEEMRQEIEDLHRYVTETASVAHHQR